MPSTMADEDLTTSSVRIGTGVSPSARAFVGEGDLTVGEQGQHDASLAKC